PASQGTRGTRQRPRPPPTPTPLPLLRGPSRGPDLLGPLPSPARPRRTILRSSPRRLPPPPGQDLIPRIPHRSPTRKAAILPPARTGPLRGFPPPPGRPHRTAVRGR